jgi:protein-S-isoprenylcysteine O-methyltransferase
VVKRLLVGLCVSSSIAILPALGNAPFLAYPHLWVVLAAGVLASALQPTYNPFRVGLASRDRWTGAQIIWSVYVAQLAAVVEAVYVRYPASAAWDATTTVAFAGMVVGLAIRTWAVYTLGAYFTLHMSIEEEHRVIRTGPYAFARHPSYAGALILFVSTAVFLHAYASAAMTAALLVFAFVRRVHYEEEMLRSEFGSAYDSYCADVKRFVPGVW